MFVKVGDVVQYSEDLLAADNSKNIFGGKKLSVLKVDISKIISLSDTIFDVFFTYSGTMYKEDGIDSNGFKLINNKLVKVFEPWDGGFSSTTNVSVPDENDRCRKCDTMGENRGLSCICPHCGNVIWGI